MNNQKELVDLLVALTRMVKNMPADQFDKLIKGSPSSLSRSKKKKAKVKGSPSSLSRSMKKKAKVKGSPPSLPRSMKKIRRASPLTVMPPLSEVNDALLSRLLAVRTPDAGMRILEGAFSRKEGLLKFANFLNIPVQKRTNLTGFAIKLSRPRLVGASTAKLYEGAIPPNSGGSRSLSSFWLRRESCPPCPPPASRRPCMQSEKFFSGRPVRD